MNTTTIQTQEIARDKWPAYFRMLAEQYHGWATTIEVLAGELGIQPAANGLPFQGLSYDPGGSQAGDILVEVGDIGTPFESHLIHRPRVVRFATTQPGEEADIEFEAEDGVVTLVRIRRRPELPPPSPA